MLLGRNIGDSGDDGEGEGAGLVGVLAEAGAPLLGEGHPCFEVEQPPASRRMSARARYRQENVETWKSQKKCFFTPLKTFTILEE